MQIVRTCASSAASLTMGLALAAGSLIPGEVLAQVSDGPVAFQAGMLVGRGYDSISGLLKADCVQFQEAHQPPAAVEEVLYSSELVSSAADIVADTQVEAGASLNIGIFSTSMAMSYAQNVKLTSFDAAMLARAVVQDRWQIATSQRLKPEFEALPRTAPVDFRSRCGDRYVAGLLYGGTLMANVTAQTESEDETKKIQAAMQLSVGPFGADAKVKEETTRALQSVRYTVTGFISGGAARQLGTTIDDLNARLQSFVQEVHQSGGAEVFALLSDYSGITAVDVPQAASTTIEHIANMYWDLTSVLHELDYIDAHPQQYNMDLSGWRPHLQALRKSATASQDQLLKAASTCRESLERCAIPTTTDASSIRAQYPLRYRGVCDRVLFDPPNIAVYPLEHTGGDADIDGHNPKIEVEVGVSVDDNGYTINATTDVNIRETGGDQTEYHGKNKTQLINLMVDHPNCFVEATGVNPSAGALTAWGGPNNHGEDDYSGGTGLLAEAQCRSDTNGEDTGKLGCRYISLRPMTLLLRHDEERLDDGSRRLRLLEQQGLVTSGSDKARRRALSDSTQLRAWAMRAAANQGASEVLSQLRGGGSIRRGPTSPRVSDLAIPRFEQPVIPGSH